MKERDPLDALLREWKLPEPNGELDRRVMEAYRSTKYSGQAYARLWRQFWAMRVSIPAPVLLAVVLVVVALILWLRTSVFSAPSYEPSAVVTRLNVTGFKPLPNGVARVVPAMDVQR
jgi:hypothetical protein